MLVKALYRHPLVVVHIFLTDWVSRPFLKDCRIQALLNDGITQVR